MAATLQILFVADCIRRDRPQLRDKWHVDEVVITIQGEKHWLWRAIDADGDALDSLVLPRRNTDEIQSEYKGCKAISEEIDCSVRPAQGDCDR